jgi:hypothetical protein
LTELINLTVTVTLLSGMLMLGVVSAIVKVLYVFSGCDVNFKLKRLQSLSLDQRLGKRNFWLHFGPSVRLQDILFVRSCLPNVRDASGLLDSLV